MFSNILLPHTTGNCPKKRNKTCGKDIEMIEWDGNAGEST